MVWYHHQHHHQQHHHHPPAIGFRDLYSILGNAVESRVYTFLDDRFYMQRTCFFVGQGYEECAYKQKHPNNYVPSLDFVYDSEANAAITAVLTLTLTPAVHKSLFVRQICRQWGRRAKPFVIIVFSTRSSVLFFLGMRLRPSCNRPSCYYIIL